MNTVNRHKYRHAIQGTQYGAILRFENIYSNLIMIAFFVFSRLVFSLCEEVLCYSLNVTSLKPILVALVYALSRRDI
jgi:hypothetical protein